MSLIEADALFIRAALREARKALGQTSPNPAVGAVLVIRNRIVARGHHRRAGGLHAEVECLRNFGKPIPEDATLYVTLEPCSTTGRTSACTTRIIKAGVKTVVIGAIDVNPRHSGRGIEILRRAGIEVRVGILADECASINEAFNKWIVTGKPFVIAKCGMSLDGRLTRPSTESRWITSGSARRHAHALRADVDAILVGAETVRRDNPRLTVRGRGHAKQPLRILLTRSGNLPRKARVFTDRFGEKTVVYRGKSLESVLRDLGRKNVTSVLIEGGGDVLGQALDEEVIDKMQIYLGPILTGGPVIAFPGPGKGATHEAARLERVRYEKIGQNLCITGYPRYRAIASTE
jgi:diaminohydroxyphosphoribosylaminopyrimidine deaminase / 5-amino-6-(5-phosphoribosylamino)uracil reductase